jgi:thiamine-phosphate pyrophosphorylase
LSETSSNVRCYITDRRSIGGVDGLLAVIERNIEAGIDFIQIREKDLPARELYQLVSRVTQIPRSRTRILVNTRVDVALAAGADGVHLPASSPPPRSWASGVPREFVFGVSCHTIDELKTAEQDGATFAVFGPVFSPLSKQDSRAPVGVEGLSTAASSVKIPVLALGGITAENEAACLQAGAAGVAAITWFQRQ